MGIGVYAKAFRNPDTGLITPVEDLETLAVEAFRRLGMSASVQMTPSEQRRSVARKEAKNMRAGQSPNPPQIVVGRKVGGLHQ
ncbi:hypothetical protein ACFS4T_28390 [Pseudomonas lini]